MSESKQGAYGEPWRKSLRGGLPCIEEQSGVFVAWIVDGSQRERTIACVNALASVADVSTVAAKIRLADAILDVIEGPLLHSLRLNVVEKLVFNYRWEINKQQEIGDGKAAE